MKPISFLRYTYERLSARTIHDTILSQALRLCRYQPVALHFIFTPPHLTDLFIFPAGHFIRNPPPYENLKEIPPFLANSAPLSTNEYCLAARSP